MKTPRSPWSQVLAGLVAPMVVLVAPDTRAASACTRSDTALFWLVERTEAGKETCYPEAPIVDVDVNSAVLVRINPTALASERISGTKLSGPLVTRIQRLTVLQTRFTESLARSQELGQAAEALWSQSQRMDGAQLERFQAAYGALLGTLTDIKAYLLEVDPAGGQLRFDALFSPGKPLGKSIEEFFQAENTSVQAQVDHLLRGATQTLEVVAYLGEPATQIHVPGYDNLTPGTPHPIEKTRFVFDERFQAEYRAAVELSASATSLNGLKAQATRMLSEQLSSLRDAVMGLAARELQDALSAVGPALAADPAVVKAKAAVSACQAASTVLLPPLKEAAQPASGVDAAQLLASTVSALQNGKPQAQACLNAVSGAVTAWGALASDKRGALASLSPPLEALSRAIALVSASVAQSDAASLPTLTTLATPLHEATDTEFSLINTPRKEGDLLTVRARVLDKDGKIVPGGETLHYLRVRSRGFLTDTGAAVLFARGIRPDAGALLPAAGAYAVIRFKGWRGDDDANSNFFHVLAPGIGVAAVGIPQAQDGSTKITWMVTGHLFGDILQAGVGVSTTMEPYWAVGLGLHRIAGLGKYVP